MDSFQESGVWKFDPQTHHIAITVGHKTDPNYFYDLVDENTLVPPKRMPGCKDVMRRSITLLSISTDLHIGGLETDLWRLSQLDDRDVLLPSDRAEPSLAFDAISHTFSLQTGCGSFAGTYTGKLGPIVMRIGETKLQSWQCKAPFAALIPKLRAAIANVRSVEICCGHLHFLDARGRHVADFVSVPI